jgi:hypothetical protein
VRRAAAPACLFCKIEQGDVAFTAAGTGRLQAAATTRVGMQVVGSG